MSSEIQKGKTIQHGYGGRAESNLEITVAVRNKDTGQWEKPRLNAQETHAVKGAIETIRQMGANAAAWRVANQKGAVLEMTESGIFLKEGEDWKDLLSDPQAGGEPVRDALKVITTIAGEKLKQTGAVPKDVAQHAEDLQQGDVVIEVRVIPAAISNLKGHHASRQEITKRLGAFVKAYKDNRELFESLMRKQGVSDLESASIFNHYVMLHKALETWDAAFQNIVDLANKEKYSEALKAYALLVDTALPQLLEQVRNARLAIHRLGEPRVQKAFQAFALKALLSNDRQVFADLRGVERIGTTLQAAFTEYIENAYDAGVTVPEEAMQAFNKMGELIRSEEVALSQYSRLFTQNQRLMQFFNYGGLMANLNHPLGQKWKEILKKYGWTLKKIQEYTNYTNQYAAHIRPLQQAQLAITREVDPVKKRALQAQLKELARNSMPQVFRIQRELQKLGGVNQLRSLSHAAEELYSQATKQNIQTIQGLQKEAVALVSLMEDRITYVNGLYTDLGLVLPPQGTISSALLQGPHAKNPAFVNTLKNKRWDLAKIQKLSIWYDAYLKEVFPLDQAKRNLDADPGNVILQKEFRKIVENQIPKLNTLAKEFKATFGAKQSLKDLEGAIDIYKGKITKALPSLESAQLAAGTDSIGISREVENAKTSLQMLSSWKIADAFDHNETFIKEMVHLAYQPMSWDKDFLSELVPNSKSPLMGYGVSKGKAPWETFLQDQELTAQDVQSILKLLNKYQHHLERIVILERKLEAHPEDDHLRDNLIHQLSIHINALQSLDQEYKGMSEKMGLLEQARQDFKTRLTDDIKNMKNAAKLTQGEAREAAEATERAASNLLLIVNRLGVLDAFQQKRDFVADLMRRFTGRRRTVA